ncbi:hypothetical protein M8J77_005540 [Diaphorina citri]|nr:hypothetical protein M8J77_005540 [Diaphorina citri]
MLHLVSIWMGDHLGNAAEMLTGDHVGNAAEMLLTFLGLSGWMRTCLISEKIAHGPHVYLTIHHGGYISLSVAWSHDVVYCGVCGQDEPTDQGTKDQLITRKQELDQERNQPGEMLWTVHYWLSTRDFWMAC